MVYIKDSLWTKNGNSSFLKPKIRGLYTRAVTDQERVIVARVRYLINPNKPDLNLILDRVGPTGSKYGLSLVRLGPQGPNSVRVGWVHLAALP